MNKQPFSGLSTGTIAIFVVAILVSIVGLYTENNGFLLAGGIFFVVSLITGINQISKKG